MVSYVSLRCQLVILFCILGLTVWVRDCLFRSIYTGSTPILFLSVTQLYMFNQGPGFCEPSYNGCNAITYYLAE